MAMQAEEKKIVLYGAQGLGRETAYILSLLPQWKAIGYFDDNLPVGEKIGYEKLPILDFPSTIAAYQELSVVICIANPQAKCSVYDKLVKYKNISLPTIIAPTAIVAPDAEISDGCIIGHFAVVGPNTHIGKCVLMNTKSAVGHDTTIGDFSTFLSSANISGNVIMGQRCFCGDQTFVVQGKKIGNNVTIGAGSRVFTNVPDDWHVFGYPAVRI